MWERMQKDERDIKVGIDNHDDITNLKDMKDALSLIKQGPENTKYCGGINVFGEAEEKLLVTSFPHSVSMSCQFKVLYTLYVCACMCMCPCLWNIPIFHANYPLFCFWKKFLMVFAVIVYFISAHLPFKQAAFLHILMLQPL